MRYRVYAGFVAPDYCGAAVKPDTYEGYRREVVAFLSWARARGHRLTSINIIDYHLCAYLHFIHCTRGKGACSRALSGMAHFRPECRGRLGCSSLAMRGINRMQPGKQANPVAWHIAVLIAWFLSRVFGFRYGVATVVAGHCLLRVGELVRIRTTDVVERGDDRFGCTNPTMVIRLSKTKAGRVQSVSVDNPDVERLIIVLLRCTKAGERLFPFSEDKFRRVMAVACQRLGLRMHFTPHGLRHGGATEHWMRLRNIALLCLRGRWASEKSCLNYLQEGEMAYVAQHVIPSHLRQLALVFVADIYGTLSQTH
jgi:hypothetical protein